MLRNVKSSVYQCGHVISEQTLVPEYHETRTKDEIHTVIKYLKARTFRGISNRQEIE